MNKIYLRKEFLHKRNSYTTIEKKSFDSLLQKQLSKHTFPNLNYLLSYYPIEKHNEPNTFMFSVYLKEMNPAVHICKPRINADGSMNAVETNSETVYTKNRYEIPEPSEDKIVPPQKIDVVFVPLLAFDVKGYRVGYGKGFYDKYLSLCNKNIVKIGFSYFPPVHFIEDTNEYDVPLTLCFTPFEVYEF